MSGAERIATEIQAVASMRESAARYPDDPGVRRLVADLLAHSPRFTQLWDEGRSGHWPSQTKTIDHPDLGPITVDCDSLFVPLVDQTMIVYSAAPDTSAAEALRLLRVIGTQELSIRHG